MCGDKGSNQGVQQGGDSPASTTCNTMLARWAERAGTAAVATFDGRGAAAARCSADTRRDTADKMISRQQRPYLDVQRTFLIFYKQSINP